MKKTLLVLIMLIVMLTATCVQAETAFDGNAQQMYDAIRWNLNLPKQTTLVQAQEYLCKMGSVQVHTLLMELSVPSTMEMIYGAAAKILLVDLTTGTVIDYVSFNGDVRWPDGELTNADEALHLLFNGYWSYLDGSNSFIVSEHEIIFPVGEETVCAINDALAEVFIR